MLPHKHERWSLRWPPLTPCSCRRSSGRWKRRLRYMRKAPNMSDHLFWDLVPVQPSGGRWGRREVSWWDRIERVVLVVVAFRSAQRLCRCPCVVPRPTVRHSLPLRGRGAAYPLRARRRLASPSTSDRRIDGTTRGRLARTRGSVTRDGGDMSEYCTECGAHENDWGKGPGMDELTNEISRLRALLERATGLLRRTYGRIDYGKEWATSVGEARAFLPDIDAELRREG